MTGRPTLFGHLESLALLVALFVLCAIARPLLGVRRALRPRR